MLDDNALRSPDVERYVVGVVALDAETGKVLVLRRTADDFMGGLWELPSGQVDDGEEFDQALQRELREETGLELLGRPRILGTFEYLSRSGRKTRQINYAGPVRPAKIVLSEHDAWAWLDPEQAEHWPVSEETRTAIREAFAGGSS